MSDFPFHPELFAAWGRALAALGDDGIHWLSHYASVDLEHEVRGLSIRGIREEHLAIGVAEVLIKAFPTWPWGTIYLDTANVDNGWVVIIAQDPVGRRSERPRTEDEDDDERGMQADTLPQAIHRLRTKREPKTQAPPPPRTSASGRDGIASRRRRDPAIRRLRARLRRESDRPRETPADEPERSERVVLHARLATAYRRYGSRRLAHLHLARAADLACGAVGGAPLATPSTPGLEALPPWTRRELGWWWRLAHGGRFSAAACRQLGALLPYWARHDRAADTLCAVQAYLVVKSRLWPSSGPRDGVSP